jgi:hypothetical protein
VLNRDGRLWVTENGGKKWSEIRTTGTRRAYDMAWGNSKNGYLAVDRLAKEARTGYVLRSDDGGHTWRPQLVSSAPLRGGGLVATAKRTLFALGGVDRLFYTTTGGDLGARSTMTITPSTTRLTGLTKVKVNGRSVPSTAGATAYVSVRPLYGGAWRTYTAITDASGRFSVNFKASKSSVLVARWLGSAGIDGDGSNIVALRKIR